MGCTGWHRQKSKEISRKIAQRTERATTILKWA